MPLSEIPSPFEKKGSYADHFEKIFEDELKKVDIKPEFIKQGEMNKKGAYVNLIKLILEKRKNIIQKIPYF